MYLSAQAPGPGSPWGPSERCLRSEQLYTLCDPDQVLLPRSRDCSLQVNLTVTSCQGAQVHHSHPRTYSQGLLSPYPGHTFFLKTDLGLLSPGASRRGHQDKYDLGTPDSEVSEKHDAVLFGKGEYSEVESGQSN